MRKAALITGATSGIGYELAKHFAQDGYDLVLVSRTKEDLDKVAGEMKDRFGARSKVLAKDLSRPESCLEIFYEMEQEGLVPEALVNNAGFGLFGKYAETDWATERRMMDLNVISLAYLTKLFLKAMIERKRGRILNVASTAAFQPGPLMAVYYATKAFVLSFSQALAQELEGTGVTVTALCPGPTETRFRERAGMGTLKVFSKHLALPVETVAKQGYEGLMKGKGVVIPGFRNWALAQSVRLVPASVAAKTVRKIQESRKG